MGFSISTTDKESYKSKVIYRVEGKEARCMKKVWRYVESNRNSCATCFYQIFFRNHPKYVKYFREDNIPEFILDARMQKKFSTICTIMSAFFIDYYKRPSQREHLLGYMAMVHKDMLLTADDLQNFIMSLIDMLVQTQPRLMSAECTMAHLKYLTSLTNRMLYLIEIEIQNDIARENEIQKGSKTGCRWLKGKESTFIYGRPLDYWHAQKRYWHSRFVFWSSINDESYLSVTRKQGMISLSHSVSDKNKEDSASCSINKQGNNLILTQIPSSTESSDMINRIKEAQRIFQANKIANVPILPDNENQPQKDKKRRWRKSDGIMDARVSYAEPAMSLNRKRSVQRSLERQTGGRVVTKNTQAFLDAVQALKIQKNTSDSDNSTELDNSVPNVTSFSARQRRRIRENAQRIQDMSVMKREFSQSPNDHLAQFFKKILLQVLLEEVGENKSEDVKVSVQSKTSQDAGTSTI